MDPVESEEARLRSVALQNAQSILRARRRAEDELSRQSDWLRVTLSSIGDAVISTDTEARVTFVNGVAESLTGWKSEEAVGLPLGDVFRIVNESTRVAVENPATRALREGKVVGLANHTVLIARDGTERAIDDSAAPIRDEEGRVVGCVLVFRDVSGRRAGERALGESEAFSRGVLESSPDCLKVLDADGRLLRMNATGMGIMEIDDFSTVEGCPWWDLWPAEGRGAVQDALETARAHGSARFQGLCTTAKGTPKWWDIMVSPVRDKGGRLTGFVSVSRDMTEIKRTEDALLESRNRLAAMNDELHARVHELQTLLEVLPVGVFVAHDPACTTITANPAGAAMLSMSPVSNASKTGPDSTRLPFRVLKDGVEVSGDDLPMQRAARSGKPVLGEEVDVVRADGSTLTLYEYAAPLFDRSGQVRGCLGVFADITQRKHAEMAMGRLAAIIESSHDPIISKQLDGVIISWNRSAERLFGYSEAEAVGRHISLIIPSERRFEEDEVLSRLRRGEVIDHFETVRQAKDGRRLNISLTISPIKDGAGRIIGASKIARDISERKRAEAALRESEDRFRTLADNISQFAWTADETGWIYWYNKRWYEYTGTTLEEMKGWGWTTVHHPDHVDRIVESFGSCVRAGVPWEDTFPLRGSHGEYRWFLSRALPVRDEAGRIVVWFGTNTDITEQREIEEELARHKEELEQRVQERTRELVATHERLRISERFASMGVLSAGLGHDMGNLLLPVRVRLDALERAARTAREREDVQGIRASVDYLHKLSDGLRLLSVDPQASRVGDAIDLGPWWADAQGVIKSVLPPGVVLEARMPDEECLTGISKAALTQVVFNLVQNAGQAMKERGRGTVRVRGWCADHSMWISVTDDGPGMTDEVKARCMEPFFTTKTRAISTGLGLVLVYGLVREVGGSIELRSELGEGTTFTVRLPPAEKPRTGRPAGVGDDPVVVDVNDARLRAFITGELRARGIDTSAFAGRPGSASLFVLDDAGKLGAVPKAGRAVFIGEKVEGVAADVRFMGEKPAFGAVREAIQGLIDAGGV